MFWVISVYFNVRNFLPKSGTFPQDILCIYICFINITKNVTNVVLLQRWKLITILVTAMTAKVTSVALSSGNLNFKSLGRLI